MQIQNLITLLLFLVGTSTYAQTASEIQNDIFKCRSHHNASIVPGNTDVSVADKWCQSVMSSVIFCAEKELLKAYSQGNIKQDQITALRAQFKYKCSTNPTASGTASLNSAQSAQATQAQSAQNAQLQQAQAAQAAQAAAQQNQATAAQAQQDKQDGLQQSAQLISAIAPLAGKVEEAYDKAAAAQAKPADAAATTPAPASTTAAPTQNVSAPAPAAESPINTSTSTEMMGPPSPPATAADTSLTIGGKTYTDTELSNMPVEQRETLFAEHSKEVSAQAQEVGKLGDGVKAEMKGIDGPIDANTSAAQQGGNVTPPKTEMTMAAEKANTELQTQLKSTVDPLSQSLMTGTYQFKTTSPALNTYTGVITAYEGVKKTCLGLAEKTEFLCIEGTSPGAVAAKTLVSSAGPILAAVNSAQKACSNTSKITGLAAMGLTVAKGVCMASQMACTTSCSAALAKLKSSVTTYTSNATTASTTDQKLAYAECAKLLSGYGACIGEANAKVAAVKSALAQVQTITQKEAAPTPGTSAGLAAKCKMKLADALMMAANVASLMLAKKNADECDKKLSTAGVAGAGATVTQYCETPANASTQFCSCQKEPNKEGCPGFTASTSTVDKEKQDQKGLDLKGVGGKSSFAGSGNKGFDPSTGLPTGVSDSEASGDESQLSLSGSGSGTTFGGGGGGNAAGAGGAGSAAAGSSNPPVEREKKKWDFGSFASSLFGGGGGSKGKNTTNGNLKQKEAIERKIASDKLSREVSSASGKSNWEKIRQAYLIKENTLLTGQ